MKWPRAWFLCVGILVRCEQQYQIDRGMEARHGVNVVNSGASKKKGRPNDGFTAFKRSYCVR